jgi:hypothetical protein
MSAEIRPSLFNTYLVDAIGSVFVGLYTLLDKDPPPIVSAFIVLAPMIAVGTWFHRYLRRAKVAVPYDFGFFFWLGWPVVIPLYAVRMHGRRGWRLVAQLFALALFPSVFGVLIGIVAILGS